MGIPTPDFAYATAHLWLTIGDSVNAARVLDAMFASLRTTEPDALYETGKASALAAAIALRAGLAMQLKGDAAAHRWAAAPTTLWPAADASFRSVASKMSRHANPR
jgi:hypothetical protein